MAEEPRFTTHRGRSVITLLNAASEQKFRGALVTASKKMINNARGHREAPRYYAPGISHTPLPTNQIHGVRDVGTLSVQQPGLLVYTCLARRKISGKVARRISFHLSVKHLVRRVTINADGLM